MGWKLDLTLHLRTLHSALGTYALTALITYPDLGEVDHRTISIEIKPEE
jgi:hypothetical protein